jgi:DNA/RNA endonuclease YhcR with UshA esterase domain
MNIGDIDKSFVGKTVNVTGEITSISNNKGNIFINVKDETGEIKVVLWEDTIKSINANDLDTNKLNKGSKINIIGDVQIYRGEMEIIPIRGSVKIM